MSLSESNCLVRINGGFFASLDYPQVVQMGEDVHFIPVGFDFERLIQPISQGTLNADRVILLHSPGNGDPNRSARLAGRMVGKLDEAFDKILGLNVSTEEVEQIDDYEAIYEYAYNWILEEVQEGNEVYVNISSMPRTVAFAFATAADSLSIEYPAIRNSIHTYYVSPEEYLVLDMIDELKAEKAFLEERIADQSDPELMERFDRISELVDDVLERGVTEGARQMNGDRHVEFPAPPVADLRDFEKEVLRFLSQEEETRSTTQLAKQLAKSMEEEYGESFKSRTQYNVESLEEKGYIERIQDGNRLRTRLSKMGSLWVATHPEEIAIE